MYCSWNYMSDSDFADTGAHNSMHSQYILYLLLGKVQAEYQKAVL